MRAAMMRKCNSIENINKRPRCGHDVEMIITRMSLNNFMSKIRFVSHVLKLYDCSHAKII